MPTHILTAMGIAAFTPAMDITRAIDTQVTILTVEPIIDPRATILIAGRRWLPCNTGSMTQKDRPPAVFPIARCAAAALESARFHWSCS